MRVAANAFRYVTNAGCSVRDGCGHRAWDWPTYWQCGEAEMPNNARLGRSLSRLLKLAGAGEASLY